MQSRPYDGKAGRKIWLSRTEQTRLLDAVAEDEPNRRLALELGLHGLRTDEIVQVEPRHVEPLAHADGDAYRLVVPDGKTGRRETPISTTLQQRIAMFRGAAGVNQDDPLLDYSKRSVRDWIASARETVAGETGNERWHDLGMHDLRRTFATDGYYSLAAQGVPIAEQLIMSWGGWAQTTTGRETFREDYLGPVPDRITAQTMGELGLP
jgi:integrase